MSRPLHATGVDFNLFFSVHLNLSHLLLPPSLENSWKIFHSSNPFSSEERHIYIAADSFGYDLRNDMKMMLFCEVTAVQELRFSRRQRQGWSQIWTEHLFVTDKVLSPALLPCKCTQHELHSKQIISSGRKIVFDKRTVAVAIRCVEFDIHNVHVRPSMLFTYIRSSATQAHCTLNGVCQQPSTNKSRQMSHIWNILPSEDDYGISYLFTLCDVYCLLFGVQCSFIAILSLRFASHFEY